MRPRAARRIRLAKGELEARVMDILWDDGGQLTSAEVNARLDSDPKLAYTTVMTILVRLFEKGEVTRARRGRAWTYRASLGREESTAQRMNAVLRDGGDQSISLARFIENMSSKQRAEMRNLLELRSRKP